MISRHGREMEAPRPRRTVRRENGRDLMFMLTPFVKRGGIFTPFYCEKKRSGYMIVYVNIVTKSSVK